MDVTVGNRSVDVLDCPRPIDHILGRHIPSWYDPGVLIAVLADIEEILSARGECAPADALIARRCVELSLESRQQLAGDVRRDAVPLGWVDEVEENEIEESYLPLLIEALHQPRPIDILGAGAEDVHDVGAVVALALHHERLLPDQLLDGRDLHRYAEDLGFHGVLEPCVVDTCESVARAENEIDVIAALPGLGEPVREGDLRPVAGEGQ